MTSAKFWGFLTPSLPLSELVIFSYTPCVLETSYLESTPPLNIVFGILHFACIHVVKSRHHLNQEHFKDGTRKQWSSECWFEKAENFGNLAH